MNKLIINVDDAKRENTTLNKIKKTLSNYNLTEIELIIFKIIGTSNQYNNIKRIESACEFLSKELNKKCEIRV